MADFYAPVTRATNALAGPAAPLPYAVANWSDADLRDLSGLDPSFGLTDLAFWPVNVAVPAFDPAAEILTDTIEALKVNAKTFTASGTQGKRPLTADEIAVLNPVPPTVTNYQARAVMLQFFLPDGRSLFNAVDGDLKAANQAAAALPDNDPQRIQADVAFQAWEQANVYERNGNLVAALAAKYDLTDAQTDDLFRQAQSVTA